MKNYNLFQFVKIVFLAPMLFFIGCQDFDEPEFGDYPLDGPIITLTNPNPNGTTVIQSIDPLASININFTVSDDISISNIKVAVDGIDVYDEAVSLTQLLSMFKIWFTVMLMQECILLR